jgi:predicted N-formylglutamate amidohydrolase
MSLPAASLPAAGLPAASLPALLAPDEPAPFRVENPHGGSRVLFTADHAGRLIPRALNNLGLAPAELERHIACDIGIDATTARLARLLDATAIFQTYSRLVIDCNRHPDVPSAFPVISEATPIPGNANLTREEKLQRRQAIFDPYHEKIEQLKGGKIYIAMHSFTPVYLGVERPMQVAVLYNRNPRLSLILAELLRQEGDLAVAENLPYQVSDATDYGVPVHAEAGGLDYLEIEIRQDLIADPAGQSAWAQRLARLLPAAIETLNGS